MQGLLGYSALLLLAFVLSENRGRVALRIVLSGVALQWALALLFIKLTSDLVALESQSHLLLMLLRIFSVLPTLQVRLIESAKIADCHLDRELCFEDIYVKRLDRLTDDIIKALALGRSSWSTSRGKIALALGLCRPSTAEKRAAIT